MGGKLFIDSVVVNGVQVEPYISSEPGQYWPGSLTSLLSSIVNETGGLR